MSKRGQEPKRTLLVSTKSGQSPEHRGCEGVTSARGILNPSDSRDGRAEILKQHGD